MTLEGVEKPPGPRRETQVWKQLPRRAGWAARGPQPPAAPVLPAPPPPQYLVPLLLQLGHLALQGGHLLPVDLAVHPGLLELQQGLLLLFPELGRGVRAVGDRRGRNRVSSSAPECDSQEHRRDAVPTRSAWVLRVAVLSIPCPEQGTKVTPLPCACSSTGRLPTVPSPFAATHQTPGSHRAPCTCTCTCPCPHRLCAGPVCSSPTRWPWTVSWC